MLHRSTVVIANQILFVPGDANPTFRLLLVAVEDIDRSRTLERVVEPVRIAAFLGPIEGQFKSMRGGSWLSAADETTVTIRDSFDPLVARTNLGFRCAMTPP